jgi:hypothetical protein
MPTITVKKQIDKKKGMTRSAQWSDKQKYEAVASYLAIGNMVIVSENLSIPLITLKKWKASGWWEGLVKQIRESTRIEVSGKLSKIIDKSAKLVEDRLDNGELKVNADGSLRRIPVNARTAGDILSKSIDKQVLLDKIRIAPDSIKADTVIDRLKAIEERLQAAGTLSRHSPKVIEAEFVETHIDKG